MLRSQIQERYGHTSVSPAKGHEYGAPLLRGEAERTVSVQPGKQKVQGMLLVCINTRCEEMKRVTDSSSECPQTGQEVVKPTMEFLLNTRNQFLLCGWSTPAQVSMRPYGWNLCLVRQWNWWDTALGNLLQLTLFKQMVDLRRSFPSSVILWIYHSE